MVRLPQPGATRHDVMDALDFAAANSTQREAEWTKMVPEIRTKSKNAAMIGQPVKEGASEGMHETDASAVMSSECSAEQLSDADFLEVETDTDSFQDEGSTLGEEDEAIPGMGEDGKVTDGDLDSDCSSSGMHGVSDDDSVVFVPDEEVQDWMTSLLPYGGVVKNTLGHICSWRVCERKFDFPCSIFLKLFIFLPPPECLQQMLHFWAQNPELEFTVAHRSITKL